MALWADVSGAILSLRLSRNSLGVHRAGDGERHRLVRVGSIRSDSRCTVQLWSYGRKLWDADVVATMSDVAERAGVSLSTVSYALSGVRPVSESTKQRIRLAMEQLDFSPNAVAQGLAGRRTKIIAMVLPTDEIPMDPFTGQIIVGAAEAARRSGYHLLLWTEPASRASEIKVLLRQGLIDGAIVLAIQLDDPRIAMLDAANLPLAMVGRTAEAGEVPYIDADPSAIAQLAVEHLAASGRRSLAYVADEPSDPDAGYGIAVRLHAELLRQADEFGVEIVSVFEGRTAREAASSVARVFAGRPDVDGVLALGDVMLGGCLAGVVSEGRSIPGDVAVAGLLCSDFAAELVHPRATTISPRPADLGSGAAEAIVGLLDDGDVAQRLLPPELSVRMSS